MTLKLGYPELPINTYEEFSLAKARLIDILDELEGIALELGLEEMGSENSKKSPKSYHPRRISHRIRWGGFQRQVYGRERPSRRRNTTIKAQSDNCRDNDCKVWRR